MTAVFSHGRLRLYLLKLLNDGPRHGYELIRLLENRFLGLYAPSAGTIYPRLQRLEAAGQVTHTTDGGRKVYEVTESGRAELRRRAGELAELESDIKESVADLSELAGQIQQELRGSTRGLKRELREATRQAGGERPAGSTPSARRERRRPPPGTPTGEAELDRCLGEFVGEFVAQARALVDSARRVGAGPGPTRDVLQRTLDEAVDTLRRLLR
jgi:DNA-binding PadR family transcriptional regulator